MFHCALTAFETLDITITTNGSSYIAQLPAGYDDQSGNRFSILVSLDSVAGYGSDVKELIFCLLQFDREEDAEYRLWDGAQTKRVIVDPRHREAILSAIIQMTRALVDDTKPRVVTMVTHSAGLPAKALTKYSSIAHSLAEMGYKAGKSDVWHGRHTWMMERCI